MKNLWVLFLVLFIGTMGRLSGQTGYMKIETVAESREYSFHFPVVYTHNKQVQEKINIQLQLGELELLKGKETKSLFERIKPHPELFSERKVFMNYEILTNSNRNLAVRFSESSAGMTMSYWIRYYNFNPQNGDRYSLPDFFSERDFTAFKEYVTMIRKEKINRQQDGEEYFYLSKYIETDDLDDFYFTDDSIYIDNRNLLHKSQFDFEANDHITAIPLSDIEHWLNDFGRSALITGNGLDLYRSTGEPQLYEGLIDHTYGFYLLFRLEGKWEDAVGIYAYKKYGAGISLRGTFSENQFVFTETNEQLEETATIRFKKEGDMLTGYWEDKKGRKLSFKAKRK
jgi:hypothetical protein